MSNLEEKYLKFVLKAHRHTYAAPKEIRDKHRMQIPFLPGHKCYYYPDGDWEYYDGYIGSEMAPGREFFSYKGMPFSAMSYQGQQNQSYPDEFFQNQVFPFLREALMKATEDIPFRGLNGFRDKNLLYGFTIKGNWKYFKAREKIIYIPDGNEVFFQDVMGSRSL